MILFLRVVSIYKHTSNCSWLYEYRLRNRGLCLSVFSPHVENPIYFPGLDHWFADIWKIDIKASM